MFNQASKTAVKKKWSTKDFVKHYFFGGGKGVTLSNVGLASDFENSPSVKALTEGFISDTLDQPVFNLSSSETGVSDVTNVPNLFSVGNSTLTMDATCQSGSCSFNFSINDSFKDPLDIFDLFSGNVEIGIPYSITHSWTVKRSYGQ